jgi:L-threonylcarbamoyladenylate synthase|tara:strand:- start:530 stop:1483 length:954 start_codon:yes stop_codon:yes gene_type:complete
MKDTYSNIFSFNKKILSKTIKVLNQGSVVGLPTETVYGLAGNAYSKYSISRIYKLKKRPKLNPLIVHYYDYKKAVNDVIFTKNFFKLYKKFCPGPITFILKKKAQSKIHPYAAAKLNTVAVRFPKHKIVRTILKKLKFPLAMPSANISSCVSPVSAFDVFDEFNNNINLIVNGGLSKIGIESTVIDLTNKPKILRPGIIDIVKIEKILQTRLIKRPYSSKIKSPGMIKKHYSPGIPVLINQTKYDNKSAYIYLGKKYRNNKNFFSLSSNSNLDEAASKLYKTFREIKKRGFKKIQIAKIPSKGPGIAINDRIKKAAN